MHPEYIGRFKIDNELGRGGQGVVYLATDPQLERNVAIKTIHFDKPSAKLKAQFIQESRTVSKLQHPNIITLFESDEHLGRPYLVFEYVDGESLREKLSREGKLTEKQAIELISPVLNAIAYAHKRGVVHRDLNPHNIMITSDNTPRIMDFGIACLLSQKPETGIWGSLKYLSPEQCENKNITATSDIYTLGLILLEMLTGQSLIDSDNRFTIINKIVNEPIKLPKTISPAIKQVLTKALQKKSEDRYTDAIDMRQDLLNYLQQISPATSVQKTDLPDSAKNNSTLQFLLRRMEHKKDFPTMSHQVVEISQKAQAGNEFSANALSNAILKDYSLSTKLLRLVNSPLYGHYGGRISTVSRAVVILGFEEVRNAALGLMLLDHLKNKNQASALKDACISSMMSGSMASGLAAKLKLKDTEEAHVCAMFHNLGKLLAIYYFPDEVEIIQDLMQQKGMKEEFATRSVLGVSYQDIGIAVGESWQLPSDIIDSMSSMPGGELKKPMSQSDLLKHLAGFSNEYCELINTTSVRDKQQAFEALASRYSNTLSISKSQMENILSDAVDEMEKYASLVNLDLQNSQIFKKANHWNNRSDTKQIKEQIEEEDNELYRQQQSFELNRQENIIYAMQEITDAILEGAPLNDILVMIMETIFTEFKFTRVVFCFINKGRSAVNAKFGFGEDVETIINRLSIPLGNNKYIFNKALNDCKDLVIEDIQDKNNQQLMPEWYMKKYTRKSMLVYPIVVKNIPMGVLFADSLMPVSVSDENQLSMIKTLRNQIILAIRQTI